MKNRKIILVALALVACMLVGVGYAEIQREITIGGSASLQAQNFNVGFSSITWTGVTDNDTNDGATPAVSAERHTLVLNTAQDFSPVLFQTSLTVTGLAKSGDSVVIDYVITNGNNVPMYLTTNVPTGTIFDFEGKFVDGATKSDTFILDSEDTVIYRVTVTLDNDQFDAEKTESFNISINATSNLPNPS